MKEAQMFSWIEFYQKFARKLLEYRENRPELIRKLKNVFAECKKNHPEILPRKNGEREEHVFDFPRLEKDENDPNLDIDPFTVFGFFNKGLKPVNRSIIIRGVLKEFEIDSGLEPIDFDAIPVVYNQRAVFFRWRDGDDKGRNKRGAEDINHLWELFSDALLLAENENEANEKQFAVAFDSVVRNGESSIGKVSMGLFWIAPAKFIALDKKNLALLCKEGKLSDGIVLKGKREKEALADVHGEDYLAICKAVKGKLEVENRFQSGFAEFSYAAEQYAKERNDLQTKKEEGDAMMENNETTSSPTKHPLNQILFGPPGTGKTYSVVEKAVEICAPEFVAGLQDNDELRRKKIKDKFEELKEQKRIAFVTFHQSYGYEDFIGGIKPTVEKGNVIYEYEPGVFKSFCDSAKDVSNFDDAFTKLQRILGERESPLPLETQPENAAFHVRLNKRGNLTLLTTSQMKDSGSLTKENIRKELLGEKVYDGWHGYFRGVLKYLTDKCGFKGEVKSKDLPYVFIIDEINRGNIAKIFGELITLIEPSKRVGDKKGEGLRVKLPNAEDGEEDFGVPNNVYIIGTMNTADRSIAMLDTALRRRFEFVEMMPNYKVLRDEFGEDEAGSKIRGVDKGGNEVGIDVAKMLKVMNERIEVLLDREHQVGHAYFLEALKEHPTIDNLGKLFQNKIIPLLQEYFYDDYEKIRLVLGDGQDKSLDFVEKIEMFGDGDKAKELFPGHGNIEEVIGDEKCVYHVKPWDEDRMKNVYLNPLAYQKIYKGVKKEGKDEEEGETA